MRTGRDPEQGAAVVSDLESFAWRLGTTREKLQAESQRPG